MVKANQPKKALWRQDVIAEELRKARLRFISTELGLARTFCQVALSTSNRDRREANISHARSAYTAAKRYACQMDLTTLENERIADQLHHLGEALSQLSCDLTLWATFR